MRTVLAALLTAGVVLAAPAGWAAPPHCPPGHAKKGWCAPGEAGWRVGDRLSRGSYVVVEYPGRRGLPPAPTGRVHVEVDDDILLLATATGIIVDILARD